MDNNIRISPINISYGSKIKQKTERAVQKTDTAQFHKPIHKKSKAPLIITGLAFIGAIVTVGILAYKQKLSKMPATLPGKIPTPANTEKSNELSQNLTEVVSNLTKQIKECQNSTSNGMSAELESELQSIIQKLNDFASSNKNEADYKELLDIISKINIPTISEKINNSGEIGKELDTIENLLSSLERSVHELNSNFEPYGIRKGIDSSGVADEIIKPEKAAETVIPEGMQKLTELKSTPSAKFPQNKVMATGDDIIFEKGIAKTKDGKPYTGIAEFVNSSEGQENPEKISACYVTFSKGRITKSTKVADDEVIYKKSYKKQMLAQGGKNTGTILSIEEKKGNHFTDTKIVKPLIKGKEGKPILISKADKNYQMNSLREIFRYEKTPEGFNLFDTKKGLLRMKGKMRDICFDKTNLETICTGKDPKTNMLHYTINNDIAQYYTKLVNEIPN